MTPTCYLLFGLRVRSEIALPLPISERVPHDVEILRGVVHHGPADVWSCAEPVPFRCTRSGGHIVLDWDGMRFDVTSDRIIVDADNIPAAVIPLMQAVWSVLLSARSREALHASVLARDGRAVAIAGPSGSGKSTAALALLDHGWTLVSDDMLTLDGSGCALPGPPFIRLMPDRAAGRPGSWDASGKLRYVPDLCAGPVPLASVLVHMEGVVAPRRLSGVSAVDALVANPYNDVLMFPGQALRRLDFAMALASGTTVHAVPPRSLTIDQIESLVAPGMVLT
jgi:hypothetical protein